MRLQGLKPLFFCVFLAGLKFRPSGGVVHHVLGGEWATFGFFAEGDEHQADD